MALPVRLFLHAYTSFFCLSPLIFSCPWLSLPPLIYSISAFLSLFSFKCFNFLHFSRSISPLLLLISPLALFLVLELFQPPLQALPFISTFPLLSLMGRQAGDGDRWRPKTSVHTKNGDALKHASHSHTFQFFIWSSSWWQPLWKFSTFSSGKFNCVCV